MSNILAYWSLKRTLSARADADTLIVGVYERLRHHESISDEPLFWLQYAIAMVEVPKLDAANEYIQAAYRKASSIKGFQTYQIDTQAFRIAVMIATREDNNRLVSNLDEIVKGMERINAMLTDNSHRSYAVRVLEVVPPFVNARRLDLKRGELIAVQFWLQEIFKSLDNLPTDFKVMTASEMVRVKIGQSVSLLIHQSSA